MKNTFKRCLSLLLTIILMISLSAVGASAAEAPGFTDISGSPHAHAIEELAKAGIMRGVGKGKFDPDGQTNRAMAATVLGRMAGATEKVTGEFSDVPDNAWYAGYVGWAANNGIILGDDAGHFMPNDPVTGKQMGLMLTRFARNYGIDYPDLIASEAPLTRGELAEMVYNMYTAFSGKNIVSGSQTVVFKAEDWGPAVYKTVIALDETVAADSVKKESFRVTETRESFSWVTFSSEIVRGPREITAAYPCDSKGNKVESDSSYIALEMAYDSAVGYPYVTVNEQSRCSDIYELTISLGDSKLKTAAGAVIDGVTVGPVDLSKALAPELDKVDLTGKFTGKDGKTLTYASYAPADDGRKHPLVIWIHGMGEGGTDPSIAMLGNEVTALVKDQFQSLMGGAYVLVPQTAGFWLQYDETDLSKWQGNPGVKSIYTETLKELIDKYVTDHPGIDSSRIIIGGCSNGGYMTMNMVLTYPDYFAAAFPICEAYADSGITDAQLEAIKDIPMWFVWAKDDPLVTPSVYEEPTIARLEKLGAEIRSSVFETGGHASWVYFFNDQCEDDGVNMWEWLSQQAATAYTIHFDFPDYNNFGDLPAMMTINTEAGTYRLVYDTPWEHKDVTGWYLPNGKEMIVGVTSGVDGMFLTDDIVIERVAPVIYKFYQDNGLSTDRKTYDPATCTHRWLNGVCAACGKECEHPAWNGSACAVCGVVCTHPSHDKDTLICDTCGQRGNHTFVDGKCACGATTIFAVDTIPEKYKAEADAAHSGTIESITYETYAYAYAKDKGVDPKTVPVTKTARVYLPAGYDPAKQYDILYLLHGGGGNENEWFHYNDIGEALYTKNILDQGIASGEFKETIVVTPTFYCGDEYDGVADQNLLVAEFGHELINELMPAVEGKYSTYAGGDTSADSLKASRAHRAYAGLSMGSMVSFQSILSYCTEYIGYVGSYSGGPIATTGQELYDYTDGIFQDLNDQIYYWFNGNGLRDIAHDPHFACYFYTLEKYGKLFQDGRNSCWVDYHDGTHGYDWWQLDLLNSMRVFFQLDESGENAALQAQQAAGTLH